MKAELHPEYVEAHVTCTCGNSFTTRSTKSNLSVEICSNCHPFYTGKQKLMDTGGRVERFRRRAAKSSGPSAPAARTPAETATAADSGGAASTPAESTPVESTPAAS